MRLLGLVFVPKSRSFFKNMYILGQVTPFDLGFCEGQCSKKSVKF